uniref:Probable G-protein coupled receptor 33 n=1 Tax=Pelusios castaneus TaxID=367368 RepID=A0A8C8RQT2_9SAUR
MKHFLWSCRFEPTDYFPFPNEVTLNQTRELFKAPHLASAVLLFSTFLVGVVGNGLYLWVLGVKMRRTVTTLWFLHLIFCCLLATLLIPFFAIYVLLGFHWVFSTAICKLHYTCTDLGMFSSVFLLAFISLDRYALTCHPIWCRHHRTLPRAKKLVMGMWLVAFILSAPNLAFRKTYMVDGSRIICNNSYSLSEDWNGTEMQAKVQLAVFTVQFLLSFLLPFCTIAACYVWMGLEMKVKGLAQSGKPFKVMVASVVSFFVFWLPYHVYLCLGLARNVSASLKETFLVIVTVTFCFNVCFTPVLYLFIGETFQQVLRTSLLALVKAAFDEDLNTDESGPESSGRQGPEISSMEMEKN